MEGINLSTFFIGAATMYFTMWAVLTLTRHPRSRFQSVLGWIFVVWAVFNLKDIIITFPRLYTEQVQNYILIVDGWSAMTYTVFIFELTMPGWTTWRRMAMMGIPFALFTLIYTLFPSDQILYAYVAFLWCYAWVIVIIAFIRARRYLRYIRDNYSNIDHIDISWLRIAFWFVIINQLTWLGTSLMYNVYIDALYYISSILMWQVVIYYSYDFHPITPSPTTYHPSPTTHDYPFAGELERLGEQEALYLKSDLSLDDLTNRLLTNRTYLSDYFNSVKHVTFYDYINQLRITQKALPMIQQHPEFTLEYIATESGFKSISTFRRAFRKLLGVSPSQYRRDQLHT